MRDVNLELAGLLYDSDGAETLESIVDACLERGWSCAGITDHWSLF